MSRPWLTVGIVSAVVIGLGFAGLTLAPSAYFPIGFSLLLVGFPGLAVSLIGGGARIVQKRGLGSKVLAAAMLVLAILVALYALLLILAVLGVINPM